MFSIKGITSSDLEILRKYLVAKELPKNVSIFESGGDANSMYFVESGAIKLVTRKSRDGGDDVVQGIVKPGGFCGEEAVLSEGGKYQYHAITHESSTIMELSKDSMQLLMMKSMAVGTKILLGISKSYREAISAPEQMAKILSFYSPKDGVGKTTLAINTALSLAKAKKRVAFIDCDFQFGNSRVFLGANATPNIGRMIQIEESLKYDRIQLFLQKRFDIDILMCPDLPQEAEMITRSILNQIVMEMARNYDYLVLDVQSHLDDLSLLLWDNADCLAIVSQPELASLARIQRLFKVFERLNYPREKFVFLLNRFYPEAQEFLGEAKKFVPTNTFTISDNPETARKAQFKGVPWLLSAADSNMAQDLEVFAKSLLGVQREKQIEKGGIFGRIKSMFA